MAGCLGPTENEYSLNVQGTKAKYARPTSFTFPQPTAQPTQQTAGGVPSSPVGAAYSGRPGSQAGGVPSQGMAYTGQQGTPAQGVPSYGGGYAEYMGQGGLSAGAAIP